MSKRILITPRSLTQHHSPDLQALENAGYELVYVRPGITPTEEELLELVPDCVGWLAGVEPVSERVLRAATNLKVISRNGTGVDNIPLKLAQELRIKVLRVEAANARGVAELAICLALAALRHLPALHCALKQGKWKLIRGSEIRGRLFGLVGCGAVGKIVARLALGLDARVAAFDVCLSGSLFQAGRRLLLDVARRSLSNGRYPQFALSTFTRWTTLDRPQSAKQFERRQLSR